MSCKFICVQKLNPVKYSAYINMYQDHVFCSTCEVYFKKPFPKLCLCCNNNVRNVKRGKKIKDPLYPKIHGRANQWIVRDILAAQAGGRI